MVLLRVEQNGWGGRWGNRAKHIDVLRCDQCNREYQLKHRTVNDAPLTFCSKSCMARSPIISQVKKETCLKRYGVEFVSQAPIAKLNRHLTKKRNGTYGRSLVEDRLYRFLSEQYVNVERWPCVNGWSIDFYVKSRNAWVQLDGVYWHGLIGPYSALTDAQRRVYDKDRRQDEWFRTHSMRLVRITDMQLHECERTGNWSPLTTRLGD